MPHIAELLEASKKALQIIDYIKRNIDTNVVANRVVQATMAARAFGFIEQRQRFSALPAIIRTALYRIWEEQDATKKNSTTFTPLTEEEWLEELRTTGSMRHGLHPEDEIDYITWVEQHGAN